MPGQRILKIGGLIAGVVMIAFGIVSIVLGIDARDTVRTELGREFIVGSPDMSPSEIAKAVNEAGLTDVDLPTCDVADEDITTGDEARCFAQYMRVHALESSNGLTYAQMGRFQLASNTSDPKGTSDEALAAKDDQGRPVANGPRNTWVTETALSTGLNVSFMVERLGIYTIIIGIALLLSGIGFIILALAVLGNGSPKPPETAPATG
jgi:hypothetical protein